MEITKVKITKENTLTVTYIDTDKNTVTVDGNNIVHGDMKAAFKNLVGHMAILCELREAKENSLPDELKDLSTVEVTGYSIGGTDEDEGVTLIGKRFLQSKKVLNLIAPFTKYNNDNEEYPFAFELMNAIEACNYEAEQYLTAKKWAIVQQELQFEEGAPKDVAPDSVPDAPFSDDANIVLTEEDVKQINEAARASMKVVRKPRRSRKKEIA